MPSSCLANSHRLDIGSRIWAFDWYKNRWPQWPWTAKWPLFCVILLNLVVSGAHCVKVVDRAITMDNLWLLCLVVNICRGTARRPRYKYSITARWKFCSRLINSKINAQYLPSYRLDIGSRIWAFDWYQNRWPWMTLNGEIALFCVIFTEFGSFRAHCVKVVDRAITMDNLR